MPLTQATETDPLVAGFLQPPKTFSPVPIWWWSGERLDRRRLRWQLERFAEGGVFNLIVLNLAPTSPLYGSDPDDPQFLSEAWWEIFLGMCEDARELGVQIWFYDQLGFSGANFQGQVVSAESRFAGQWLESTVYEGTDAVELVCPAEGTPLAAAVTPLDEAGPPARPPPPPSLWSMAEPPPTADQNGASASPTPYAEDSTISASKAAPTCSTACTANLNAAQPTSSER